MKKLAAVLLLALGALGTDAAQAAPPGIPERKIDLDLKQAAATNVYRLLGEVSGRTVTLDPCLDATTIDLRLKNTPLPLLFDALATQLKVVYEDDVNGGIYVRCQQAAAAGGAAPAPRVSVRETNAPLPDVVGRLAAAAKLTGVDYRATKRPAVSIELNDVRLGTAMAALSDSTGLHLAIRGDRLSVAD